LNESREKFLKKIYSEIISGLSIYTLDGEAVYIQHLSPIDNLEIEYYYNYYYEKLINKGIFSREDRLAKMISDGLWTNEKEKEIEYIKDVIRDLNTNRKRVYTRADFESFDSQIKEQENKLLILLNEKYVLLGSCAEDRAERRMSFLTLQKSLFRDKNLEYSWLKKEDLNELDDEESEKYFKLYSKFDKDFTLSNVKCVALCNFFQNSYHLANSTYEFYGIPMINLTDYQTALIN